MNSRECELLEEINRNIPKNIDWKRGAITYLRRLIEEGGESYERWHYTKPFLSVALAGGALHGDEQKNAVERDVFFREMYLFLNLMQKLNLPPKSKILDVGCGPGWTSHLLGKLGHSVVGIDISADMLEIARKRTDSDPYAPYPEKTFDIRFIQADIESEKLKIDEIFDFALFESTFHHFYDPISSLKNISHNLDGDSLIAIIEGEAPQNGAIDQINEKIMRKYHTLERPYTKKQLTDILHLCGFEYVMFYVPLNGLVEHIVEPSTVVDDIEIRGLNIVIASKNADPMQRVSPEFFGHDSIQLYFRGFYDEECEGERIFRWSKPQSVISLGNLSYLKLLIRSVYPSITGKEQAIHIFLDEQWFKQMVLTPEHDNLEVEFTDLKDVRSVKIYSDSVFCPNVFGINEDMRQLSFIVEILELR